MPVAADSARPAHVTGYVPSRFGQVAEACQQRTFSKDCKLTYFHALIYAPSIGSIGSIGSVIARLLSPHYLIVFAWPRCLPPCSPNSLPLPPCRSLLRVCFCPSQVMTRTEVMPRLDASKIYVSSAVSSCMIKGESSAVASREEVLCSAVHRHQSLSLLIIVCRRGLPRI